jgi:hypothetical protein
MPLVAFDLSGHFERGAFILNIMTMTALLARHSRVGGIAIVRLSKHYEES